MLATSVALLGAAPVAFDHIDVVFCPQSRIAALLDLCGVVALHAAGGLRTLRIGGPVSTAAEVTAIAEVLLAAKATLRALTVTIDGVRGIGTSTECACAVEQMPRLRRLTVSYCTALDGKAWRAVVRRGLANRRLRYAVALDATGVFGDRNTFRRRRRATDNNLNSDSSSNAESD
jgi:hypothetical protein